MSGLKEVLRRVNRISNIRNFPETEPLSYFYIYIVVTNGKLCPIRVRPRYTWHGGSAPTALPKVKKVFEV